MESSPSVTAVSVRVSRKEFSAMDTARTRVTAGGQVVLPARFRESVGLQIGDEVIVELGDGELRLIPSSVALRRAQELVETIRRQHAQSGGRAAGRTSARSLAYISLFSMPRRCWRLCSVTLAHVVAEAHRAGAVISSVNLSEVVAKLVDAGMPADAVHAIVRSLGLEVATFATTQAIEAGLLRLETRRLGLSLGNRGLPGSGSSSSSTDPDHGARAWAKLQDELGRAGYR